MTSSANSLDRPRIHEFVRRVIAAWRAGVPLGREPETADLLNRYPELRRIKSVVLDLAYEEFCLRREGGKSLDLGLFCRGFPTFGRSLERLLLLHEHLNPLLEAAVSAPPRSWPAVGERVGDFELLELLGQGGVSRVFLARHGDLGGRTVVVKISPYPTVEADAIGRLGHPHIVPILSQQSTPDGSWVLVCMPYLGRRTLADDLHERFASDRLNSASHREAVVRCIRQLADALATTHERGLLHGDLKPSNVLLDFHGAPRLMDFHLAEPIGQATFRVSGTLPYMSPELLVALLSGSGRTARISDARSDLFSLGVMLVESLTGKLPFGEPDSTVSLARQVEQQLERRRSSWTDWDHDPSSDPALLAIASACLAYDLRDRIPSAESLRNRLDDYLAGCERRRRRKARSCHMVGIFGGVAALIVVACGAIVWHGSASGAPQRLEDSTAALREYGEAREFYAAGHVVAATNRITACVNLVPTDPRPLVARGHVYRRRGLRESDKMSWELAALDYARALRWEDSGFTRACLAECYLRREHPREAITHGEAAQRMGYESAALHGNLALAYAAVGDWQAADRAMREAMRIDSSLQPLPAPSQPRSVPLEVWRFAARIQTIPGEFSDLP